MRKGLSLGVMCLFMVAVVTQVSWAAPEAVTLVANGRPACCLVVPQEVLDATSDQGHLRQAADDLVVYLKKMSGAEIQMGATPVEGLLPIYLGKAAGDVKLAKSSEFGDAYVVDVAKDRIVLLGESDRSTYYAAAHLLHELGVRWYAPGEIGECVPSTQTVTVPVGRTDEAPDFQTRNLWGGERWFVRNRTGGPMVGQGHIYAGIMQPYPVDKYPDYYPIVDGQVRRQQVNMSNPEVVRIFAETYARRLRAGAHSVSFCPDDGFLLDERPESIAMDSGRIDPIFKMPSATERLVKFGNAICKQLRQLLPEDQLGYLGFYVYANYNMPPQETKLDAMLLPIMAPIAFNRYSSIGNPNAPTSMLLKEYTLGWAAMTEHIGCYLYNFNLADTAMPFTRRLAWSIDIPNLYKWGLRYCTMESMPNWHTMVPGNYVISRLLWDVDAAPQQMLDEFYPLYYGPAAEPMRRYNTILEGAYENSGTYAGNLWSMHRILTPDVMRTLQAALGEAEMKAKGHPIIEQRLQITRHSMEYARLWFAARDAISRFELAAASHYADEFLKNYETAHARFPVFFADYNASYFRSFHYRAFQDAGRVAREGEIVYRFPDEWTAYLDEEKTGEERGLHLPSASTQGWTKLRTYSDAIAEQGYPLFRGLIWYRHTFRLPPGASTAKELHLWLGGVDDNPHVYLNGQDLGRHRGGNFAAVDVDITGAINRAGDNVLVLALDNTGITELGTGGLVRPALIYARKE